MTSIQAVRLVAYNANPQPQFFSSEFGRRRAFERKFKLVRNDGFIDPRAVELANYLETKFRDEASGHMMKTYLPDEIPTSIGKVAIVLLHQRGLKGNFDESTNCFNLF